MKLAISALLLSLAIILVTSEPSESTGRRLKKRFWGLHERQPRPGAKDRPPRFWGLHEAKPRSDALDRQPRFGGLYQASQRLQPLDRKPRFWGLHEKPHRPEAKDREPRFWGMFEDKDNSTTTKKPATTTPSPKEMALKALEKTALAVADVARDLMELQEAIEPLVGINAAEAAAAEEAAKQLVIDSIN